jgi:hypothetical protein
MLGDSRRGRSGAMAHAFCVEDPIPKDHILRRIDAVLDTSWVREEVAACYGTTGRPSWDPEVIVVNTAIEIGTPVPVHSKPMTICRFPRLPSRL